MPLFSYIGRFYLFALRQRPASTTLYILEPNQTLNIPLLNNSKGGVWLDKKWWVIGAILVLAVIAAAIIFNFNRGGGQNSPVLTFNLETLSGKVGESPQLSVSIRNDGGEAKGVIVNLVSDAFDKASSNSIDVPANQTKNVQCNVHIKDVANNEYSVTISYQYNGGVETPSSNTALFQVVPSIEIVGVQWPRPFGYPLVPEKSTIGRNDNTTLFFQIKSHSAVWTYTHLSATATVQSSTVGLTITPNSINLEDIGPSGTSKQYSFGLFSSNMPPGTYAITIHIFSIGQHGQYEAVNSSVTLTVSQ